MPERIERTLASRRFRGQLATRVKRLILLPFFAASLLLTPVLKASPAAADSTPCDCETCHVDPHGANWQGCSGCHQSPPQTGSHLAHYNSAPLMILRYGDTAVASTTDAYKFGCGNCHPLDRAKHRDGTVEVELYDASAPAGSLKAKNPSEAIYAAGSAPGTGTCNNVYCHSGYTVTSSTVGDPLTSPPNPVPVGHTVNSTYIMDASCSNLTYAPYTVTYARVYKTTPAWGQSFSNPRTCTECHGFPPTTSDPQVSAGAGDSHQWIDEWGYRNLHAWNMGFDPVPCRTCHYSSVMQAGSYSPTIGEGLIVYDAVPLSSHVTHVNGAPDVVFDTVNDVTYRNTYSLNSATYDSTTRTCSDVACHYSPTGRSARWQQKPKWGGPYRWDWGSAQCDLCHRMGLLETTCQPAP